jgi:threonine dehydrogenase-like Zn-dependent dehydrogenase
VTTAHGTPAVLGCVGHMPAYEMAYSAVRAGGVISRVGVPQYQDATIGTQRSLRNDRVRPRS